MTGTAVVYIVDDDRDDQDFLIAALEDIDPTIECFTANNGQEGLKKLETAAVPSPAVIFLDLNMPRINGRQMLIHLKSHPTFKIIPVIICSTSSNETEMAELKALGATDYMVKPSDGTTLKNKLLHILIAV